MRTSQRMDTPSLMITFLVFGLLAFLTAPGAHQAPTVLPGPAPVSPARPVVLNDIAGTDPTAKVVALTFDDGPDPTWTPQVLDVLARHHAVATFCMIGDEVARHRELLVRVAAAGMRLCSHSRTHDEALATRTAQTVTAEITDVAQRSTGAPGADVRYFRAPGGNWSPSLLTDAAGLGMQPLGWSVDPRDWKRPGADAIVATAQKQIHPGAIVLLHDGGGNRSQTVAALERLLPWLAEQGYTVGFPTP